MICYKDMTFCTASCAQDSCKRNWDMEDKEAYNQWSQTFGGDGQGPVAFSDFSSECPYYIPIP